MLQANIPELENIIADILEQVRKSKGSMKLVADYNKTIGLLRKKKAIEKHK